MLMTLVVLINQFVINDRAKLAILIIQLTKSEQLFHANVYENKTMSTPHSPTLNSYFLNFMAVGRLFVYFCVTYLNVKSVFSTP